MASIDHPRGKPRVRWKDPDGTPHARTCATEKAARELLREVQRCEDIGRIWQPEVRREKPTLRAIATQWIASCERRLASRTVDRLAQMGEAFLLWYEAQHGADAGPEYLSRSTMESYWDFVRTPATGRYIHRRSETTARKHMEMVHQLWEWAADREEYTDDVPPIRRMELPRKPAITPRPAPTWAEMDQAISQANGWRRCVLLVLRCTGLRVQQAMGLRWADIDGDRLILRGELGKSHVERSGRIIPIAPVLLSEWRHPCLAEWTDPDWIVPCPLEHRIVRARDIARIWKQTSARPQAWTGRPDHAFRAGFQTSLRAIGVAREATEYLVGHALPGLDASYIDPEVAFHLTAAVAKVPALEVPVLQTACRSAS